MEKNDAILNKWLTTGYSNERSQELSKNRFQTFLEWTQKTPKQLIEEFEQKRTRDLILSFQTYLKNDHIIEKGARKGKKGMSDNSTRAYVMTVRAFYNSQCEPIKGLRNKIVSARLAIGEHAFSVSDLKRIWHIANTRDKALIACGCSLGWESSAILNMKKEFFANLVKRARDQEQEFICFDTVREKTSSKQIGILNPCALDSLERWISKNTNTTSALLWNGLTQDGLNKILKRLTKEANIVTMGKIRWHLLRKWLMNTLSASGLNSFEIKIILGKAISASDATYLQTLKQTAFEKYKKAYPNAMSLVAYSNNHTINRSYKDMIQTLATVLIELYEKQVAKETSSEESEALTDLRLVLNVLKKED